MKRGTCGVRSRIVLCEAEPEFKDAALCHHGVWADSSARLLESLWEGGLVHELWQLPQS